MSLFVSLSHYTSILTHLFTLFPHILPTPTFFPFSLLFHINPTIHSLSLVLSTLQINPFTSLFLMDAKAKPSVEHLKYQVLTKYTHITHLACFQLFIFFINFFMSSSFQTWFLKVSIHCEGCRKKVNKVLKRIDGTFLTTTLTSNCMVVP